jgi:hypothetical protein
MKTEIFKKGDRVYHHVNKWGTIDECKTNLCTVKFDLLGYMVKDIDSLSFTEYTIEGFTQEPPEDAPTQGQIVWVRDDKDDRYDVNHFIHYNKNNKYPYVCSPDNDEDNIKAYKFLTTKNPYEDESGR